MHDAGEHAGPGMASLGKSGIGAEDAYMRGSRRRPRTRRGDRFRHDDRMGPVQRWPAWG